MRRLLLLGFVLAGCASADTEGGHVADSGAMQAGQTPSTQSSPTTAPTKPVGNPNRVYQLDTLKKTDVNLEGHKVHLWVMDTEGKQQEGMMFLTDPEVKADEGMLFAFKEVQPNDGNHSFWMHNTILPLDIIYISPDGKVLNVGNGKAMQDKPAVMPAGAYLNVIELKAGTAAKYGLKAGDSVAIPKLP